MRSQESRIKLVTRPATVQPHCHRPLDAEPPLRTGRHLLTGRPQYFRGATSGTSVTRQSDPLPRYVRWQNVLLFAFSQQIMRVFDQSPQSTFGKHNCGLWSNCGVPPAWKNRDYDRLFLTFSKKLKPEKLNGPKKTLGFFSPKLNEPVVIVVTWISKLILFSALLL